MSKSRARDTTAKSVIYTNRFVYEAVIRVLYGRGYNERFRPIAELIEDDSSVLDLCCGPGTLFRQYLKTKGVHYTGLDINRHFVERLSAQGATGLICNLNEASPLPRADYVIMQASLYHFLPHASSVIERMFAAAKKKILIAEPIRNLADSQFPLLALLARKLTNPGTGDQPHRFNEARLDELMDPYRARGHDVQSRLIAGGREKLYIVDVRQAHQTPGHDIGSAADSLRKQMASAPSLRTSEADQALS